MLLQAKCQCHITKKCFKHSGSIPSDTGDPLVSLARVPSPSATATSTVSHPPPPSVDSNGDGDSHAHIEDMESSAATSSRNRKRDKRRREEQCQEEEGICWMQDLCATMQANQALLEKLVEVRPYSDREAFVRFVADTLRTAPQEQYVEMMELILDIVRQGRRRQPGGIEQPSKS